MASLFTHRALPILRHYSTQTGSTITPTLLEKAAVAAYLLGAFALPAIPTYVATRQSKRDGTYDTRPRDTFPVLRPHF
ncbi:hypothetical protein E2P81_ATG02159 [Venturia nashicola]|uniref:Uncharacterized protein n=1 Tax=Venturia nashicola TaxID=86259 RepID=A0A4Z1P5Y0_9PEZI|nr:hypothetical protein E6O75_ATG02212 [Venturia nashicola]TLD35856.1 hypothetical protein E2P81_ATG02159 [Venturia nashicola]